MRSAGVSSTVRFLLLPCMLALGLMPVLSGCGSKDILPPDTGGQLSTDPSVVPQVRVVLGDRLVRLDWTVDDTTRVSQYRVFRSKQETGGYTFLRSVSALGTTDATVQNGQLYFYQVASVLKDGRVSEPSTAVSAVPSLYSVLIDGGLPRTRGMTLDLQLSAPSDTRQMQLSSTPDFQGAAWEPFQPTRSFTLTPGDGPRTIYVRFRDATGNDTAPVSDQIVLDTQAFLDSTEFAPSGLVLAPGQVVHFRLVTRGAELGGTAQVRLGDRMVVTLNDQGVNGDTRAGDGIYEADFTLPRGMDVLRVPAVGRFVDQAGNSAPDLPADSLFSLHTPPNPVTLLSVLPSADPSSTSLDLTWTADNEPGFASYQLFRADSPDGSIPDGAAFTRLTTLTGRRNVTYSDLSVREGQSYAYRVDVMDSLGFSAAGDPVVATARMRDGVILQGPVSDQAPDTLDVVLRWSQSTDPAFSVYQIMRATGLDNAHVPPDNQFLTIHTEGNKQALTYTDPAPRENTWTWYRVDEISTAGARHESNAAAYLTRNAPPPAVSLSAPFEATDGQVSLSWTGSTARDFQSYRVYRARGSGADTSLSTLVLRSTTASTVSGVDNSGVLDNTTYYYRVFTTDTRGLSTPSNEQSYTTHNQPPPSVDITAVSTNGPGVGLSWQPSDALDFESYRLFRSRGVDVSNGSTQVGTVTDRAATGFFDAFGQHGSPDTLKPNTDYYYRVYVYDKGGLFRGGAPRLVHTGPWMQAAAPPPAFSKPRPAARHPAAAGRRG